MVKLELFEDMGIEGMIIEKGRYEVIFWHLFIIIPILNVQ